MWVKDLFHFEKSERYTKDTYYIFDVLFISGKTGPYSAEFSSSEVCWILNPETLR